MRTVNKVSPFRLIEILMLIIAIHLVENARVTNNTSIGIIDNRLGRYRRTSNVQSHSCGINQYFDKEESRCRGVPGGGKVLHINTVKSCGINTLKSHCSNPKYYYICKGNTTIIAECADGQHFDERLHRCIYVDQRSLSSSRIRPDREIYNHVQLPPCNKYGRFPVPGHCGLFYSCETNGHQMFQKVFKCPEKTEYNDELKSCSFSWTCNDTMSRVSSICLSDVNDNEAQLRENGGETVLENPRSTVEDATDSDSTVETSTTMPEQLSMSTIEKPILSTVDDNKKSDETPLSEVEESAYHEENSAPDSEPIPSDSTIESEKAADLTEPTVCNGQNPLGNESCNEATVTRIPETETTVPYATQDTDDVANGNTDSVENLDAHTTVSTYSDATESSNANLEENSEDTADDLVLANHTESANSLSTESPVDSSEVFPTTSANDEAKDETPNFTAMPNAEVTSKDLNEGETAAEQSTEQTLSTSNEKESNVNPENPKTLYTSTVEPIPYSRGTGKMFTSNTSETRTKQTDSSLSHTFSGAPTTASPSTYNTIYPQTVTTTHDKSPVERIIANISERIERRVNHIIHRLSIGRNTTRAIE